MAFAGLSGKVAIVTGAAGGIGLAVVERLLDEGCSVVATDVSSAVLEKVTVSFPGKLLQAVACDVTVEDQVVRMIAKAVSHFGGVDFLVNAHGILGASGPITELQAEDFNRIYSVNIRGVFLTMKAALCQMIQQERGGAIVNIASVAALRARENRSFYGASKRAVVALTAAAAAENGEHNIRVNAIAPGAIETEMLANLARTAGVGRWDRGHRPIARNGHPAEVASLIAYLLSDDASYCTGAVYAVDGGLAI